MSEPQSALLLRKQLAGTSIIITNYIYTLWCNNVEINDHVFHEHAWVRDHRLVNWT